MVSRILAAGVILALACISTSLAQAAIRHQIDIPQQQLGTALAELAQQTRIQVVYPADLVKGRSSSALSGSMTPEEALGQLLSGTGLKFEFLDTDTVTLSRQTGSDVPTSTPSGAPQPTVQAGETHATGPAKEPSRKGLLDRLLLVQAGPQQSPQAGSSGTDAASEPATPGAGLSEVIVTAQYHEQSLQSTPLAITAVSGDKLLEQGINNVNGLTHIAPSVDIQDTGSNGGKTLSAHIRGVGAGDYNFNIEPGVAFYIDGVYTGPSYGGLLDFVDLSDVEVLRGPQGTLSGKNAIGGAVRLQTQRPTGDGSGYIQAETGSYNLIRLRAAYDTSLIGDQLFMRVSGYSSKHDGDVTLLNFACANPTLVGNQSAPYALKNDQPAGAPTCARGTEGGENVHAGRVQFRWLPTENLDVNLSGDYIDDDSEAAAQVMIGMNPAGFTNYNTTIAIPQYGVPYDTRFLPPNHFTSYATFNNPIYGLNFPPVNTLKTEATTLTVAWKLSSDTTLTSISGWRKYVGDWSFDADATPLSTANVGDNQDHAQVSQELRLTGVAFADRLNWTAGAFYYHSWEQDNADVTAELYDLYIGYPNRAKDTNYAGFLDAEFKVIDTLTLIGGARETHEAKSYLFHIYDIPGTPGDSFPVPLYELTHTGYTHFDYRVGLQNQFTADFMGYATVSTGFRAGGFNPRPAAADQVVPYGPEKLINYEVGARNEFFDHRIRFNNTLFYSTYDDIQLTAQRLIPGEFPIDVVTNAGKARIYGYEGELEGRLSSWLTLNASGSYNDFRYTNLGAAAGVAGGPTLESMQVFTPRLKADVGVEFLLPLLRNYGKLTFRTDYNWRSKQYTDAPNSEQTEIRAYGLLDARLTFATKKGWELSVSGTNITNKFYWAYTNFFAGNWQWDGEPGLPAEWRLSLRRNF